LFHLEKKEIKLTRYVLNEDRLEFAPHQAGARTRMKQLHKQVPQQYKN
jgi:hypothetical protein